jgi:phosphohistidine phosphatase
MRLLLVRHGKAIEHATDLGTGPRADAATRDAARWLTDEGRRRTRDVGRRLAADGVVPTRMLTSPLVRAVQTAEALAASLDFAGPVEVRAALVPGARPEDMAAELGEARDQTLALVGHEPHLSALVGHLLGVEFPSLPKSAVAALRRSAAGRYGFEWLLVPRTLAYVESLDALER